ncbi:MAG TPA: MFS transporter [Actinoplanes sp.]|nr:MFS transporter [Actinoplanes sp.]
MSASHEHVSGRYWIWLSGVTLSLLGSQMLAFGMTWVAAGWGGAFAGAVLTAINLPRVALLLFGGALADRIGAWRVMITADLVMATAALLLGGAILLLGVQPYLLLVTAVVIGVVDAFYLPSSGSMPRRLVTAAALARAMSARQVAGQMATFAGPAAGGLLIAAAGLVAAAFVNATTFLVMALVLVGLRPRAEMSAPAPAAGGGGLRGAVDGVRVAWSEPVLRTALGLVAVAAGFLLPVSGLLIPLLAIQRRWDADLGGVLAGTVALGIVAVAVTVTAAGALRRPGAVAAGGLAVAAAGVLGLALVETVAAAIGAAAVVGIGSGVFSTHVGPLILGGTPSTHLARVQSVLVLAQSLPLLLSNNVLGSVADLLDAGAALVVCAVALLLTAVWALRSPTVAR